MKLHEISFDYDEILSHLCEMVERGQQEDPDHYGMVAACVVSPDGKRVFDLNYAVEDGHRVHAERAAIDRFEEEFGDLPDGCVVVTTLSPCSEHMHDREGKSCTDLLNEKGIKSAYCGLVDSTQIDGCMEKKKFNVQETNDIRIMEQCKAFADTFL